MSFSSWWHSLFVAKPAAAPVPATPVIPVTPVAPAPVVAAPVVNNTVVVSGTFMDRDDFMKAIGQSVIATYLDGILVHNGQGGVNFYTQQDGHTISTAPPAPLGMQPTVPTPPGVPAATPPPPVIGDVGNPGAFGPAQDHGWQPGRGNIPVASLSNQAPYPDQCYLYYMDEVKPGHDFFFAVLSGSNIDISRAQNVGGLYVAGFNPADYQSPMAAQLIAAVKAITG